MTHDKIKRQLSHNSKLHWLLNEIYYFNTGRYSDSLEDKFSTLDKITEIGLITNQEPDNMNVIEINFPNNSMMIKCEDDHTFSEMEFNSFMSLSLEDKLIQTSKHIKQSVDNEEELN